MLLQYIILQWKSAIICNMRSRDERKLSCAQIYEHPFNSKAYSIDWEAIATFFIRFHPIGFNFSNSYRSME